MITNVSIDAIDGASLVGPISYVFCSESVANPSETVNMTRDEPYWFVSGSNVTVMGSPLATNSGSIMIDPSGNKVVLSTFTLRDNSAFASLSVGVMVIWKFSPSSK